LLLPKRILLVVLKLLTKVPVVISKPFKSKAQGQMSAAAKDSSNPFFKSKYADLSSVWNACRESLSKHGFSIVQATQINEAGDITDSPQEINNTNRCNLMIGVWNRG
jgi:hypothetical protein